MDKSYKLGNGFGGCVEVSGDMRLHDVARRIEREQLRAKLFPHNVEVLHFADKYEWQDVLDFAATLHRKRPGLLRRLWLRLTGR